MTDVLKKDKLKEGVSVLTLNGRKANLQLMLWRLDLIQRF